MDEHYFSADPGVAFRRTPVQVSVWGQRLDLVSGSGVFAQGRLDPDTAVLRLRPRPVGHSPAVDGVKYALFDAARKLARNAARAANHGKVLARPALKLVG